MKRPRFDAEPWTERDDRILIAARANGEKFARIQQVYFPHRSVNACEQRIAKIKGIDRSLSLTAQMASDRNDAANGSDRLLRAIVAMCIRNGITLPGATADHTRSLARNLGVLA